MKSAVLLIRFLLILLFFTQTTITLAARTGGPDGVSCSKLKIFVAHVVVGRSNPVFNTYINLDASSSKILQVRHGCPRTAIPLPRGAWKWTLVRKPSGSKAKLSNTGTLKPRFLMDKHGPYVIKFTACPKRGSCTFNIGQRTIPVKAVTHTLVIKARTRIAPETEPRIPTNNPTNPTRIPNDNIKCAYHGGTFTPQWVTTSKWRGPQDYKLLEGIVKKARISRMDNFQNHYSQDFILHVQPYKRFNYLRARNQSDVEVEWENRYFPEKYRPSAGDRISMWGFWILDCGHKFRTEIHPPVGVVVQRPRAIKLPSTVRVWYKKRWQNMRVGSNVYVPGIVAHIWFNRNHGKIMACKQTSLHQPAKITRFGLRIGKCIRNPSPLKNSFTFNIYLPTNPRLLARRAGFSHAPEVPVFVRVHGGTNPAPSYRVVGDGHIQVTVKRFSGKKYGRRIEVGWLYPSPDNWGLKRWRIKINHINVHNDGDSAFRGDGDWRFWFNFKNKTKEWIRVFKCNGCVHGKMKRSHLLGRAPWKTGTSKMGPDILVYPNQLIHVHSSGFEKDGLVDDDTGTVNIGLRQSARRVKLRSICKPVYDPPAPSYCAKYTLNLNLVKMSSIGKAKLSVATKKIYDGYNMARNLRKPGKIRALVSRRFIRRKTVYRLKKGSRVADPYRAKLVPGSRSVRLTSTLQFKKQGNEPYVLTMIKIKRLKGMISKTWKKNPAKVTKMLKEFRAQANKWKKEGLPEAAYDLYKLKSAFPKKQWNKYMTPRFEKGLMKSLKLKKRPKNLFRIR